MDRIMENRKFMKSQFGKVDIESDQKKQLPQPPLQKPVPDGVRLIDLPKVDASKLVKTDIYACLKDRRSRRKYKEESMSLEELSFLLWATQGVDEIRNNNYATARPVPSGGARHAFETYLFIFNLENLEKGIYRYLALSHQLMFIKSIENMEEAISTATGGQKFLANSQVVFAWSCIPYRSEWRYTVNAHKVMLLDAGHVCQNLYIACEAIGSGTCAIAAYDQKMCDDLCNIDGIDEYVVYLAPVAKY
jgi:SagB-type dehydrogenase family enzyme